MRWNPEQYLAFRDERSRPFSELVARVPGPAATIVDLGCGPGHLTPLLRDRWPEADIIGIDSSVDMIDRANRENADPRVRYELGDVRDWASSDTGNGAPIDSVDVIVSNATFQWVPDQLELIPRLRDRLASGGRLAFSVPNNFDQPSHRLLREVAGRAPYAEHTAGTVRATGVGPQTYLSLLAGPDWHLDVWETTYLHVLDGEDPVFGWISGTGARPVLQALPDDLRAQFSTEYRALLRAAYPRQDWGTVLPFQRVFVVAAPEPV